MSIATKILIVEHDKTDIELIEHELKKGGINYVRQIVQTEYDYTCAIKTFIPDIILSDYTFPSFDGPTAFKIKQILAPDTPFIFLSGTIGEEKSIELIKNGLTDYALKDKLFTLVTKVKRALNDAKETLQKKETEHKLVQSERQLARAQQVAHMGNWELNLANNYFWWSDETFRIYGLLPDQTRQSFKSWLSFIHPDDLDFVVKKIHGSLDSLRDFSMNYRIVQGNGTIRHIYSENKLEFDPNGKPLCLYGIAHDVTEKILLENNLASERRSRQSEITTAVLSAQERERSDIGMELHDNLNQILGATKLYINLAKTDELNRHKLLEKASCYIVDVINEIRKISKTLSSPGKMVGLFNSIKNLLDDLLIIHRIAIRFDHCDIDEGSLNKNLQLTIYRIVQEQINNILKHANASNAIISLSKQDNEVVLVISDDGEGSDNLKEINGVGIKNIKSRVELHNGTVTITSDPNKGYKLKVTFPLSKDAIGQDLLHQIEEIEVITVK